MGTAQQNWFVVMPNQTVVAGYDAELWIKVEAPFVLVTSLGFAFAKEHGANNTHGNRYWGPLGGNVVQPGTYHLEFHAELPPGENLEDVTFHPGDRVRFLLHDVNGYVAQGAPFLILSGPDHSAHVDLRYQ